MAAVGDADIIAELEAAMASSDSPDGFYSTRDLCVMLGRGEDAVRKRLKILKRRGRLEERRLLRPDELGDGASVKWCYRILPG